MRSRSRRAFTLIELLVVVAIMSLLIALLVPALEKAVYQAELASCGGGNLKSMSAAVTGYAFENKRYYPDRDIARRGYQQPGNLPINAYMLRRLSIGFDMRPLHRKLFQINKTLQCPLAPHVELDDENLTSTSERIDASYM